MEPGTGHFKYWVVSNILLSLPKEAGTEAGRITVNGYHVNILMKSRTKEKAESTGRTDLKLIQADSLQVQKTTECVSSFDVPNEPSGARRAGSEVCLACFALLTVMKLRRGKKDEIVNSDGKALSFVVVVEVKEKQERNQVEADMELDSPVSDSDLLTDTLIVDSEFREPSFIPRSIMAEPDYIDEDNPELIRPQKLINPVKSSRNHQDLHRELRMNQKRGLAPQNKPELQKVMERRKRDLVFKQKEEEAQKKKSDLEIELLKRQQKLEQLELEKQKIQEEQENAPEFVKVKGNLRRTAQDSEDAQTT
uniref:Family with sequence similarity 107 member B n=4 Tax=Anolis carolinensis TaxID=28377 RepID=A0A803U1U2_ANOCA